VSPDRTTAESGPAAENDVPTPYAAYLRTEVLHTLQERVSEAPAEMAFLVNVLAVLHRRGLPVPAAHLRRDLTEPYTPHPDVEQAWLRVYANRDPGNELYRLGELLADIAEEFTTWKYRHLMSVRRTVGDRPGFYGTSGTAWLAPTLDELPYPELWSARSTLG